MRTYSNEDIEKIGNSIIYFANKMPMISKTKLLKLLYLLEENFVRKYHLPLLNLEFEVWQAGPVARDIFIDLSDEIPILLSKFIKTKGDCNSTFIEAIRDFEDDEFSDNEIEMMDFIIEKFGSMNASDLVKYTHRKTTPWFKVATEKKLLELFEKKLTNSSDEKIDLSIILDEKDKEMYKEQNEYNSLVSFING